MKEGRKERRKEEKVKRRKGGKEERRAKILDRATQLFEQ